MNYELGKAWVGALRSGEYKQDVASLKTSIGYCCLGVLCEVLIKTKKYELKPAINSYDFVFTSDDGRREVLQTELGLFKFVVGLTNEDENTLVAMNDGRPKDGIRRHSFVEIADYIEQNLLGEPNAM